MIHPHQRTPPSNRVPERPAGILSVRTVPWKGLFVFFLIGIWERQRSKKAFITEIISVIKAAAVSDR